MISLALKGMAMGMAEVVPGISGGTIAFITGIYERLLQAIRALLGPEVWRVRQKGGWAAAWAHIDGPFLVQLLLGMIMGIVVGVFGVSWLLEHYPRLLWAFFFGIILASVWYIGRQVAYWTVMRWVGLIIGTVVAYMITVASPAVGSSSLPFVFLSGLLAISALMLPGLSGSFVLLLLGMYTIVLHKVKGLLTAPDMDGVIFVLVLGLGCLAGLAAFSRVLTWTFRHYRDVTLSVLCGFMLGSLNKLWPWREVISTRLNSHGEEVPFLERSVLPSQVNDPQLLAVIGCMVLGIVLVLALSRLDRPS